jgi:hypothetical protein
MPIAHAIPASVLALSKVGGHVKTLDFLRPCNLFTAIDRNEEDGANLCGSVIAQGCLGMDTMFLVGLLQRKRLIEVLTAWTDSDRHHKDPAFHANFDAKTANAPISARLMIKSPIMRRLDFILGKRRHPPLLPYNSVSMYAFSFGESHGSGSVSSSGFGAPQFCPRNHHLRVR